MITNTSYVVLHDVASPSVNQDCACPSTLRPKIIPPLPEASVPIYCHPELHIIELDDEYSLAFVPSLSQVAVLNQAARHLLASFVAPRLFPGLKDPRYATLVLCYQLGLLTDGSARTEPPTDTLLAWLHVTNACNLRCTYCYIEKSSEAMDATTAYAAVDAVLRSAQLHGYTKVRLKYAGGESSLNMTLVEQTHRYARQAAAGLGIALIGGVLSNGTALTNHRLQQIADLELDLMISLDGTEAAHNRQRPLLNGRGSFQATIAGINRALKLGLRPEISVTVTSESVDGLPALLPWLLDQNLVFNLNFYRPTEANLSHAELHRDEQMLIAGLRAAYAVIAKHPPTRSLLAALLDHANLATSHNRACPVGTDYLVIDQRGGVAKCQMEISQTVTTIAAPDPLAFIRADQIGVRNPSVDQKEGCRDCSWRYWCAGGCPIATFRATGRYDVRSPNCTIYTTLYPEVLRLEGQRLLYHHLYA